MRNKHHFTWHVRGKDTYFSSNIRCLPLCRPFLFTFSTSSSCPYRVHTGACIMHTVGTHYFIAAFLMCFQNQICFVCFAFVVYFPFSLILLIPLVHYSHWIWYRCVSVCRRCDFDFAICISSSMCLMWVCHCSFDRMKWPLNALLHSTIKGFCWWGGETLTRSHLSLQLILCYTGDCGSEQPEKHDGLHTKTLAYCKMRPDVAGHPGPLWHTAFQILHLHLAY